MAETVEKIDFQAEAKHVLDIVIHSLYTHKEIFLRELISNASDALDKRRYQALTRPELSPKGGKYEIFLKADAKDRTLTIRDNGIGMNRDDLVANLGTIAKSGTKEFLEALKEKKDHNAPDSLIGRFGVGFYSTFMVADTVTVLTRRAGEEKGWRWRSQGAGGYTIEEDSGAPVGTSLTLSLKKQDKDEVDFSEEASLKTVVKRYSDFITYPVYLDGNTEPLNSMKAIWTKAAKDITADEHAKFYKHISHDFNEPLESIRFSAEGASLRYDALLYLPMQAPMELFMPQRKGSIHFYVNRVLITDSCPDLTPDFLRFVCGIVDCPDVSLNISRETMQNNRQIKQIRERLVAKILDTLKHLKEGEGEKYLKFWKSFGKVFKEGLYQDGDTRERIIPLVLFESSATQKGEFSSFEDYRKRMKDGQKDIYYITGESREAAERSPHLEALRAKGYEVIYFTDPIDDVVIDRIGEFDGKALRSAGKGDIRLDESEEEKKEKEKKKADYKSLLEFLQKKLENQVKEVRFSNRLTESAVCLVADEQGMSARLEKILRHNQQAVPENKRIMEINPSHPVVEKMKILFDKDPADSRLEDFAVLLYGQGALTEGSPLPDPAQYAKLVAKLMAG